MPRISLIENEHNGPLEGDDLFPVVVNGVTKRAKNRSVNPGRAVSPRQYGAATNGATDDMAAVGMAADYARAHGVPLLFPAGTTYVSNLSGINFNGIPALIGEHGAVIKGDVGDFSGFDEAAAVKSAITISANQQVIIYNIEFLQCGHALYVPQTEVGDLHIAIKGCTFNECFSCLSTDSLYVHSNWDLNVKFVRIQDCEVKNCQRAFIISTRVERAIITGNWIHDLTANISIEPGVDRRPCMGVMLGLGYAPDLAAWDENSNCVASNNVIERMRGEGTDTTSGWNDVLPFHINGSYASIQSNVVRDISSINNENCEGIYVKCRCANVSGNILKDAGNFQAMINIKGVPSHFDLTKIEFGDGTIVHNNVLENTRNDVELNGIHVEVDAYSIQGNSIRGVTSHAIDIDLSAPVIPTSKNIIANNKITDFRYNPDIFSTEGIYLEDATSSTSIHNNLIDSGVYADTNGNAGQWVRPIHVLQTSSAAITTKSLSINNNTMRFRDYPTNEFPVAPRYSGITISAVNKIIGLSISNNNINHENMTVADQRGIWFHDTEESDPLEDITITNNVMTCDKGWENDDFPIFVDWAKLIRPIIHGNTGVVLENSGKVNIPYGSRNVNVLHQLSMLNGTLASADNLDVQLCVGNNGWGSGEHVHVYNIASSQFSINVYPEHGIAGGIDIMWRAKLRLPNT